MIGGKLGGTWVEHDSSGYGRTFWQEFSTTITWEPDPAPLTTSSTTLRSATYRRFHHPAWRVMLGFYVADELPLDRNGAPVIPECTVLPGSIQGREFPYSALCIVCRRHADTPAGNLCVKHTIAVINGELTDEQLGV